MTDWLKLTLQYLYRVRGSIFLHLASCFSIALIASLYHIPIQAIGYMILFISSMALLFLGIGCHQFRRRMQYLQVVWNGADVQLGTLPPAHDAMEQLYQDILRRTAERSTRAETESESALRRSDTYYTRWSHQVKTPLAALRLLIQEEPIDRTACENELLKTEQYVEMALQYQRLKSTENDLLLTSCPLDQVVRNAVKSLAPLFIARNLSLEIENISVSVLTDEKWLQFALEQILSNAAKYTRQGGVTIRLSDPSRPELVIQDSGIGIQPEDLPRVTDWGYTGQNGHSGTRSTGIGLALCRETREMLGHRMRSESTPGVGTSVYLDFSRNELEIF